MAKRKRNIISFPQLRSSLDEALSLETLEFEVTDKPLPLPEMQKLPRKVRDHLPTVYAMASSNPKQSLPEILKLIETYPDVFTLYNWRNTCYQALGDWKKQESGGCILKLSSLSALEIWMPPDPSEMPCFPSNLTHPN